MRILMVNKFLYPNGGSETYMMKLGEHLAGLGHQVEYFGMEHADRCVGNRVNAYTTAMDFHGGSKLSKLTYPLKTIYSAEARKKIRLVLDDFQPDVCHLNNFNYQLTPSIILEIVKWRKQTGKRCRIVYTAHDGQLVCPNHMLRNPNTQTNCEKCLDGRFSHCIWGRCIHGSTAKSIVGAAEAHFWRAAGVYRYIDTVICCSDFMRRELSADPQLEGKLVTLHNFIDSPAAAPGAAKGDYVLYFGRYSEEKGLRTLLEACRLLPDIHFVFAGRGPLEAEINALDNVENAGYREGNALKTLIQSARFSVCPSECYENCPFSVIESLSLGTPVLGADIGGIPELIVNGRTGELFESGNVQELTKELRRLWDNKKLTASYSQNCGTADFDDLKTYAGKLMQIYSADRGKETAKENILMIDNRVEDVDEFVSGLSASTRLDWKVLERTSNRSSDAVRYLKYFLGGCELFFKRKRYGTVIAWQQFYGLFFAMLCRLFHVKKSCTLIVMTVIYKDKKGLLHDLYRKFYEYSITSGHIDAMTCVAKVECDNYSRIFHLPREKFHYLQWGLKDHAAGRLCAIDDKKYIFSAGKSNRDWEFVFDTIGTGGDTRQYNAVVVGSASEYQNRFDNITVLQNISDDEYYMLLARSYCVLISIRDVTISAGQITLLQAMQFGKPVILTQSEGLTNDYVIDGVNGLVVEKEKRPLWVHWNGSIPISSFIKRFPSAPAKHMRQAFQAIEWGWIWASFWRSSAPPHRRPALAAGPGDMPASAPASGAWILQQPNRNAREANASKKTERHRHRDLPLQRAVHDVQPVQGSVQTGRGAQHRYHPQAAGDVLYQHHRRRAVPPHRPQGHRARAV